MVNFFLFAGESSKDYGIYISGENTFNAPQKEYETQTILGKSGDLLIDKNRYKNIPVTYPAFIRQKFAFHAEAARNWLLSQSGYQRLEDSYNPDLFRLGYFAGPIDFDMRFLNQSGEMELTFICKPYRYRKSGEKSVILTSSNTMYNPERFSAKPYIKIVGNGAGTLTVGDKVWELKGIDEYLEIDSEMMNCFKGTELRNNMVSGEGFPELAPGKTGISWTGNISHVEIKPRWCTI